MAVGVGAPATLVAKTVGAFVGATGALVATTAGALVGGGGGVWPAPGAHAAETTTTKPDTTVNKRRLESRALLIDGLQTCSWRLLLVGDIDEGRVVRLLQVDIGRLDFLVERLQRLEHELRAALR